MPFVRRRRLTPSEKRDRFLPPKKGRDPIAWGGRQNLHSLEGFDRSKIARPNPGVPILFVLCGPSGAGKSTFAAKHFKPSEIVSSDRVRWMIADSEAWRGDEDFHLWTFGIQEIILHARLKMGRDAVADQTALSWDGRNAKLRTATHVNASPVLLAIDAPLEILLERQSERAPDRRVEPHVVKRQKEQMESAKKLIPLEVPWDWIGVQGWQ